MATSLGAGTLSTPLLTLPVTEDIHCSDLQGDFAKPVVTGQEKKHFVQVKYAYNR